MIRDDVVDVIAEDAARNCDIAMITLCRSYRQLRNIVDKLPETADGVPIVPGMRVFYCGQCGITDTCAVAVEETRIRGTGYGERYLGHIISADQCYSTREAESRGRSAKTN